MVNSVRPRHAAALLVAALAVLMGGGPALAAQGDLTFWRLGDLPHAEWFAVASYGNSVYVGGIYQAPTSDQHTAVLRRYDRSGAVIWTRTIHGPKGQRAWISGVAADASGVYVTGTWGNQWAFVARYQPNATRLWFETINDLGGDTTGEAIDTYGSYIYLAGTVQDVPYPAPVTTFVRKYTLDTVNVWTRLLPMDDSGYVRSVLPTGVAAAADVVYVVGSGFLADAAPNQSAIFVRAYDQEGDHPRTDVRPIEYDSRAVAVAADSGGAYVVAHAQTDVAFYGSFLLKYDSTASFLWQRRITARSSTRANAVALAPSGVWIGGTATDRLTNQPGTSADPDGDDFIVRYSRSGTPLLTYQYSDPSGQRGNGVAADWAGAYLVGYTAQFHGQPVDYRRRYNALLLGIEVP